MILIFGTSIAMGQWDEKGGWAQRIKAFADKKALSTNLDDCILVYPLGISGNNSDRLLKRFDIEVEARKGDETNLQIVVEVGINDSYYIDAENRNCVPIENYEKNLLKIIEKSKRYNADLIFVGLTPVDKRVDPVPWERDISFRMDLVKRYENILKKVCEETSTPFVEILSKFIEKDYEKLLIDGLHPNSKGHELIYNEVLKHLQGKKYI